MGRREDHLAAAVRMALDNVRNHGGAPFGAVLVKDERIVARAVNTTAATGDPTAHAELEAIRAATRSRRSPRLEGHVMYASGQPCPMCLAAMYLAGIEQCCYAYGNEEGEPYGLSTANLYAELARPFPDQAMRMEHLPVRPADADLYATWHRIQHTSSEND